MYCVYGWLSLSSNLISTTNSIFIFSHVDFWVLFTTLSCIYCHQVRLVTKSVWCSEVIGEKKESDFQLLHPLQCVKLATVDWTKLVLRRFPQTWPQHEGAEAAAATVWGASCVLSLFTFIYSLCYAHFIWSLSHSIVWFWLPLCSWWSAVAGRLGPASDSLSKHQQIIFQLELLTHSSTSKMCCCHEWCVCVVSVVTPKTNYAVFILSLFSSHNRPNVISSVARALWIFAQKSN